MFCRAQLRAWARHDDALAEAGGRLLVLTTDSDDILATAPSEFDLADTFVQVQPALWAEWDLTNPKRPELPWPATVVVAPDGTITFVEIHENHRERTDPDGVVARVREARGGDVVPSGSTAISEGPDFERAVRVSAIPSDKGATLTVQVAEGFHVYGRKERTSVPLAVTVAGRGTARIPKGQRKDLTIGPSYVLEGTIQLPVRIKEGPAEGQLHVQVCTDTQCAAPTSIGWSASR